MKKIRFLAAILAVSILVGCFSLPVGASDGIENYTSSASINTEGAIAKVESMESVYKNDDYELFYDKTSGEIAIKTLATGEYTFSNPYDAEVPKTNVEAGFARKAALLSQIMVKYSDASGAAKHLSSYGDAAMLEGQIEMKRIDGGIRVEYAIGSVESKRLVPFRIEESRFEDKIVKILEATANQEGRLTDFEKQIVSQLKTVYYDRIDYMNASDTEKQTLLNRYPILATEPELVFYVLKDDSGLTLKKMENLIRTYCQEYTFDELESDHEMTGYEGNQTEPALFRLAIEYTFNENGFCATVPAKSIRYNETTYSLDEIVILPYFGCSTVREVANSDATEKKQTTDGYLFLPDGSGTILEYYNKDGSVKTGTQSISVYGIDYAYEDLTTAQTTVNAEVCRIPVFGLTEEYTITTEVARSGRANYVYSKDYTRGFVAVITEGESLAKITATLDSMQWTGYFSAGTGAGYNTVYAGFSMQQTDKVSLGSALGGGTSMSQSIDTRYIGDYALQYMLLADAEGFNAPTYSGMAEAYRNYLISSGAIAKFTADEVKAQLPLYIQTLGSMKTDDTFLTFPVKVTRSLTSFDDIEAMTGTLADAGITNLKYILTGYANGTASSSKYPSYVKFNSKVGGNSGFKDLVDFAIDEDIEVMPNFDFVNITNTAFGFSFKKHAALMMSGRYATKRDYDAVYQTISRHGHTNLISTNAYDTVYAKFSKAFDKFFTGFDGYQGSLAALTLGTDLNSDFNKDEPITREDSKNNTVKFISKLYDKYDSLVVEGGNAYTIPYVTDILSIPLDNSNYAISSASIPFMGMVLHGCMNYTGDPMNMSGDIKYAVLKSIENGASPYFFLVYSNAADLKSSPTLSAYYSVNFETWFTTDDGTSIKDTYNKINGAIGGLQNATIVNHEFHTAFELDADEAAMLFSEYKAAKDALETAKVAYEEKVLATDKAAAESKNLASYLIAERDAKAAYVAAETKLARVEAVLERNNVGGVVSVTYATEAGATKTFYINYNNYEVVFETKDGGTYAIGAMAFVEEGEIVSVKNESNPGVNFEAYAATGATLVANFTSANETLSSAVEAGNTYQINRALNAVKTLLSEVAATKDGDVAKITNANGGYVYINYTTDNVIVKMSETRYELIPAQSYLIVE